MDRRLRIGTGFDVHRLKRGVPLVLGTVEIPSDHGLISTTDGDVVTHALIDALLAVAGAPDIGTCFPPADDRWRGKPSSQMLEVVRAQHLPASFNLLQADITILAERPPLAPFYDAMRHALAEVLRTEASRITIKARSLEGLGLIGEQRAIAALVTVLAQVGQSPPERSKQGPLFAQSLVLTAEPPAGAYLVYADGGSRGNPGPAACACVIYAPEGSQLAAVSRYLGELTNNQAEYQGVLTALRELKRLALQQADIVIHLDSSLLYHQITGGFRVRNPSLRKLLQQVHGELASFENPKFKLIPRASNQTPDRLLNQELDARLR